MIHTEEFRVCPECEYQRGFHVFFRKVKGRIRIGLICPKCGQSYTVGWATASMKSVKPEKGLKY
jgi:ssDNA-binding Zn-finger/Zn-ribbon topoisomerase 1